MSYIKIYFQNWVFLTRKVYILVNFSIVSNKQVTHTFALKPQMKLNTLYKEKYVFLIYAWSDKLTKLIYNIIVVYRYIAIFEGLNLHWQFLKLGVFRNVARTVDVSWKFSGWNVYSNVRYLELRSSSLRDNYFWKLSFSGK